MDMNRQVKVKSNSSATVIFYIPEMSFKRTFEKKGVIKPIPFNVLAQGIYNEGIERMLRQGILTIEDKQARVELGLETEEEKEKEYILDDNQKKRLLTVAPLHDLKEACKKIPNQQILELVYFAIDHEYGNFEKANYLKTLTNIDIMKAIELNRAAKEENK
jgi:hypothetical protein